VIVDQFAKKHVRVEGCEQAVATHGSVGTGGGLNPALAPIGKVSCSTCMWSPTKTGQRGRGATSKKRVEGAMRARVDLKITCVLIWI
jgi:hypothetical protein